MSYSTDIIHRNNSAMTFLEGCLFVSLIYWHFNHECNNIWCALFFLFFHFNTQGSASGSCSVRNAFLMADLVVRQWYHSIGQHLCKLIVVGDMTCSSITYNGNRKKKFIFQNNCFQVNFPGAIVFFVIFRWYILRVICDVVMNLEIVLPT